MPTPLDQFSRPNSLYSNGNLKVLVRGTLYDYTNSGTTWSVTSGSVNLGTAITGTNSDSWSKSVGTCLGAPSLAARTITRSSLLTTSTTNFTWMFRVKFNTAPTDYQTIMINGNGGLRGYGLVVGANKVSLLFGGVAIYDFAYVFTTGQWYHFALRHGASGSSWRATINGTTTTSYTTSNPAAISPGDATTLFGDTSNFDLTEVVYFDRELTDNEVLLYATAPLI